MKNILGSISRAYTRLREHSRDAVPVISQNENGFCVMMPSGDERMECVRWDDVLSFRAFKRDQLTVDCICVAFELSDGWYEVNEDMQGFTELLDAAERSLPGFPRTTEWFGEVMLPPFETNERELWRRS